MLAISGERDYVEVETMSRNEDTADTRLVASTVKTPEEWEAVAGYLFRLLDDIDTLDDSCRENDHAFRECVRHVQRRRFEVATTDGYKVSFHARRYGVESKDATESRTSSLVKGV